MIRLQPPSHFFWTDRNWLGEYTGGLEESIYRDKAGIKTSFDVKPLLLISVGLFLIASVT